MRTSAAVICLLLVASALASQPRGLANHAGTTSKTKTKTTTTKAPATKAPTNPATTKAATTKAATTKAATTAAPATTAAASTAKPAAVSQKATTTTTTAKKAAVRMIKKVKVSFTFAALVFSKLKAAVKTAMKKAVTDSVLEGLGAGYTKDHVSVELKAGSVIADVHITPKEGATAAALQTSMNSTKRGAIEQTMAVKVKAVPAISEAVVAGKTLADIAAVSAAPTVVEVAAPTTQAPTAAPSTTKALQSTGASAPIAAVSIMSMLLVASQIFA